MLFKTKNIFQNIISLPLRKREGGNESGRSTGTRHSRQIHIQIQVGNATLSPIKPGDTAQRPPLLTFTRVPALQEQALEKELDVWECKRKERSGFFFPLKFLLSHWGARAIIQPDLLTSIKFEISKRERPLEKRNVWYCVCETQSKGWQFAIIQSSELRKWLRGVFLWWGTQRGGERGIQLRPSDCTTALSSQGVRD